MVSLKRFRRKRFLIYSEEEVDFGYKKISDKTFRSQAPVSCLYVSFASDDSVVGRVSIPGEQTC